MKDLITEGRKLQDNFLKNLISENRDIDDDYAWEVQQAYRILAKKMSPYQGWKFISAVGQSQPGGTDDWDAKTKNGKWITVTFAPFFESRPVFDVGIILDNDEVPDNVIRRFTKQIKSTGSPIHDAEAAIEYIRKVLSSPTIKQMRGM